MKKAIAVLLAVLLLGSLAACGGAYDAALDGVPREFAGLRLRVPPDWADQNTRGRVTYVFDGGSFALDALYSFPGEQAPALAVAAAPLLAQYVLYGEPKLSEGGVAGLPAAVHELENREFSYRLVVFESQNYTYRLLFSYFGQMPRKLKATIDEFLGALELTSGAPAFSSWPARAAEQLPESLARIEQDSGGRVFLHVVDISENNDAFFANAAKLARDFLANWDGGGELPELEYIQIDFFDGELLLFPAGAAPDDFSVRSQLLISRAARAAGIIAGKYEAAFNALGETSWDWLDD